MPPIPRPKAAALRAAALLILIAGGLIGCGPKPGYSTPAVLSPLGRRGECVACSKPIELVRQEHLFASRGAQCIVCDKKCAAKAAAMMGMEIDTAPSR